MATDLRSDRVPIPPVPARLSDEVETIAYLQKQHEYIRILLADIKHLRDTIDGYHP